MLIASSNLVRLTNIAGWCSGSTVKKQPIFDRELYSNFTKQTPTEGTSGGSIPSPATNLDMSSNWLGNLTDIQAMTVRVCTYPQIAT